MRFTIKRDAQDIDALAARIVGRRAAASRRNAVRDRILAANPHLTDFASLPPGTPIALPDDVPETDEDRAADPRFAGALRIANEALESARASLQTGFDRDEKRDEEREAQIRQVRAGATDPALTASLDDELKRLGERRTTRRSDFERFRGALDTTGEALGRLGGGGRKNPR